MKGVIFMSGKKIYSNELKLQVVERYLKGGISIRGVANEFYVDASDVRKWKDAYLEHGVSGLCTTHGTYTGDFKVSVVEYMKSTGASMRQTAAHFNIPSQPTVAKWERIYYEQGKEALYINNRGRPMMMDKTKNKSYKKNTVETNQDLLAEVQRLRMENEYLKKLNALIQEEEKSQQKRK